MSIQLLLLLCVFCTHLQIQNPFLLCLTLSAERHVLLWCRCPSSVHLPLNSGFSETHCMAPGHIYGKLPICHISRPLFSFFKIFTSFFSFSLTWEETFQNTTPTRIFMRFEPGFIINKMVMVEYKFFFFCNLSKMKI